MATLTYLKGRFTGLWILKVKYACIYELLISTDHGNPTQHGTTLIEKRKQNDVDDATSGMHC